MTTARSELVDESITSYYHCISRCARRTFLCGEGCEHRKGWIKIGSKNLAPFRDKDAQPLKTTDAWIETGSMC